MRYSTCLLPNMSCHLERRARKGLQILFPYKKFIQQQDSFKNELDYDQTTKLDAYRLQNTSGFGVLPFLQASNAGEKTRFQYSLEKSFLGGGLYESFCN